MSPSDTYNLPFSSGVNYTNNTAYRSRFEPMEGSIASFHQDFACLGHRRARLGVVRGVNIRRRHELPHWESRVTKHRHHQLVPSRCRPVGSSEGRGWDHRVVWYQAWAGIQELDLLLQALLLGLQPLLLVSQLILLSLQKQSTSG